MSNIKDFEPLWPDWVVDEKIGSGSFGSVWRMHRAALPAAAHTPQEVSI